MQNAKRVAKNTGILYVRMLISMIVSLYTTRLVLSALGVVDYGIFNLVGGVIAMLLFLNASFLPRLKLKTLKRSNAIIFNESLDSSEAKTNDFSAYL